MMTGHGAFDLRPHAASDTRDCHVHIRLLERHERGLDVAQDRPQRAARDRAGSYGPLEHAHHHSRADAMPGHVGVVPEPLPAPRPTLYPYATLCIGCKARAVACKEW